MQTITNGSIQLIDPIESVSNLNSINGTPDYEKMFIFVELTAERRGRSVIVNSTLTGTRIEKPTLSNLRVNLMGADTNGNTSKLTTKWTDNTSIKDNVLEGFGISEIDIKITSSFIPEVTIEFVDIKGMAFFNKGENSPYNILFDFPPAIYELTIKGYYGKALTYQLHLVNYSSRFDSKTGNYHITANFIARTFAPLTDIPFKLIEIMPLIDQRTEDDIDQKSQPLNLDINANEPNVDVRVAPRNTHEMIKKLEALYDNVKEIKDNSEESNAITEIQRKIKLANNLYNLLNTFRLSSKSIQNNTARIIQKRNVDFSNDKDLGKIVNSINQFNSIINAKNNALVTNDNNDASEMRLYLGVKLVDTQKDQIITALKAFKTLVLDTADDFLKIDKSEITDPLENIYLFDKINSSTTGLTQYISLDITDLYEKLFKFINDKSKELNDKNENLTEKLSQIAESSLGMKLTPYEIFKVICDDIDKFFNKLRKTNVDAEYHHNEFFNEISGNPSIIDGKTKKTNDYKLYSFPLYIQENRTEEITRQVRAYPNDLSNSLSRPFPEVELVENFVNAFINVKKFEKVENLKTQEDVQGNNKWIPVTPLDSELSHIFDYSSPYSNIELKGKEDQITNSIINVILNRFYIASQFTYGNKFYQTGNNGFLFFGDKNKKKLKKTDLINFVAGAEAVNLANSLVNNETISFFETKASQYKSNPDLFYSDINQLGIKNFLTIEGNDHLSLNLDNNSKSVYRDRTNPEYEGVYVIDNYENKAKVREVDNAASSNNPVDEYIRTNDGWWRSFIDAILSSNEIKISKFTQQNIPFLNDLPYDDSKPSSRFVEYIIPSESSTSFSLNRINGYKSNNLINIWSDILAREDNTILSVLTGVTYSNLTKAFVLISNFGYALSYFDNRVNNIFTNPALVEVANFSTLYMGGLIYYNKNTENLKTEIDGLYNNEFSNYNVFNKGNITSDSEAIKKLSKKDSELFETRFYNFINNDYDVFYNSVLKLITNVKSLVESGEIVNNLEEKNNKYIEYFNNNEGGILLTLNKRVAILNYSEYTFSNSYETISNFIPLAVSNQDTTTGGMKEANDIFFRKFFEVLSKNLPEKRDQNIKQETSFGKFLTDNDIKTQLYYTFKSISDKWISGLGDNVNKGFPFNRGSNDSLINKFIFVDRAMNPIGNDVILNVQSLIELSKDYDVNIFTVFSRLLSENGFEIFPLQNFMVHSSGSWEDIFKIFETVNQPSTPLFVCMYIGGTSSVLNTVNNDYENDGILDLGNETLSDFKETSQTLNNTENFKYSQVKAFRVRYGEQNQSFFTDIQLDSKEYPETAESLAILSNIAGDESTASPVAKGQNLFNLYENRAYSTTVTMLGNAMIQPTQYFQLENIPMFSGAYIILDVNHKITPNYMITQFQGTRILKYPQPFVTDFAVSVGINGSRVDSDIYRNTQSTAKSDQGLGTITTKNGDVLIPQLQHNSLYTLRI